MIIVIIKLKNNRETIQKIKGNKNYGKNTDVNVKKKKQKIYRIWKQD